MKELVKSLYIGENKGLHQLIIEDIIICGEEKFEAYLTMMAK